MLPVPIFCVEVDLSRGLDRPQVPTAVVLEEGQEELAKKSSGKTSGGGGIGLRLSSVLRVVSRI